MQIFRSAIVILASAVMVLGYNLPTDAEDGHWQGSIDSATGQIAWAKVGNVTARSNIPSPVGGGSARALPRRPNPSELEARDETGCTLFGWNQNSIQDLIDARNTIYDACDKGVVVKAYSVDVIKVGTVAWYACNYNNFDRPCQASDVTMTDDSINYRCGLLYAAGWDHLDSINFTYGKDSPTASMCGNL